MRNCNMWNSDFETGTVFHISFLTMLLGICAAKFYWKIIKCLWIEHNANDDDHDDYSKEFCLLYEDVYLAIVPRGMLGLCSKQQVLFVCKMYEKAGFVCGLVTLVLPYKKLHNKLCKIIKNKKNWDNI